MDLVQWSDRFSVGVRVLDHQHRKLVGMINTLNEGMREGRGRQEASQILKELREYVVLHFATEERLMSHHSYPGFPVQKREHESFRRRLAELMEENEEGKLLLSMELMQFLREWWQTHILELDKQYGPFLNRRGVK